MINKQQIIKEFGKNEKDSGNVEVQVAILTNEILNLTEHMKANKKDKHSKLGLYKKVSKRSSLLKYLRENDFERYSNLIKRLNLRK